MKIMHPAIIVVFVVAMLLLVPMGPVANARGGGLGAHSSHSSHLSTHGVPTIGLSRHRHQARPFSNFSQWPLFGGYGYNGYNGYNGYYEVPPYVSDNNITYAAPERVVYVAVPPRALTCKRSVQAVTVPAELGGTREITITRC
jgi:hypothetical protein